METFYSEQDIRKIVEYACGMQKAEDYQTAGRLLIVDEPDLKQNSILLLDELAETDTNYSGEITMFEIHKLLSE